MILSSACLPSYSKDPPFDIRDEMNTRSSALCRECGFGCPYDVVCVIALRITDSDNLFPIYKVLGDKSMIMSLSVPPKLTGVQNLVICSYLLLL